MTTIEDTLNRMADKILHLDEASLAGLWSKYRLRTENVEMSRDWEKSVLVFFIINAIRAKNQILNEKILAAKADHGEAPAPSPAPPGKPRLRLVKPGKPA